MCCAGCSIVVCTKDRLKLDVFEDLSAAKRQNICLCLFYCINWFRELVSESHGIHSNGLYQPCVCVCRCVHLLEKQMRT